MQGSDIILKYFPSLTISQQKQFTALGELYKEWNEKINVISRKDIDHLYVRHVLHSLAIAKVQPFLPGAKVLDVGTGGGFPGIPLAILFPETQFMLVDSIAKKITVVTNIAEALGMDNVNARNARAEKVKGKFDFIVSRAVTRMAPFYNWVQGKIKEESQHNLHNGILYLKGGDLEEEMKESRLNYAIYELEKFFEEDFFETKKVVYVPL